jgi:hypothetical protein
MTALAGIVPKLIVFLAAMLIGGALAFVVVSAINKPQPISAATEAPAFTANAAPDTPGAAGGPSAFDLTRQTGTPVGTLPPTDLSLAAADLLDNQPVSPLDPSGFPRVAPITQFDGGPFANANCTLASGAMLARLGWGIVTDGSTLRTLQLDQSGGTGLDDLSQALWTGYGVVPHTGLLKPAQLKDLLSKGYGAVIQGVYGNIPEPLRLQKSFTGTHAIYVDAYWPGDGKTPPAYFVIDPIGRPQWGYQGDWWPASVVDSFGTAFTTALADGREVAAIGSESNGSGAGLGAPIAGRIAAAWVFPPGGVPPNISDPDVLPIPHSGGGNPHSSGSPGPGSSLSAGGSGSPEASGPPEAGDIVPVTPVLDPLDPVVTVDDHILVPWLLVCVVQPTPPSCPNGQEGVFQPPPDIILAPPPIGPVITVKFVDSDRPNVALVGFTISQPLVADVRFWPESGSPVSAHTASSIGALSVGGETVFVANLAVEAATTYHFQVVAGDAGSGVVSPVGTFTTAAGVKVFDLTLGTATKPNWSLGTGISPYLHLGLDGLVPPLPPSGGGCPLVSFGAKSFCLIPQLLDTPIPPECPTVTVDYALAGLDVAGVHVRAFPTQKGLLGDGTVSFRAAIEGDGPPGEGKVVLGCLTSGLTYNIAIDAIGDAGGALAVKELTAP